MYDLAKLSRAAKKYDGYAAEVIVLHIEYYVWKYYRYITKIV